MAAIPFTDVAYADLCQRFGLGEFLIRQLKPGLSEVDNNDYNRLLSFFIMFLFILNILFVKCYFTFTMQDDVILEAVIVLGSILVDPKVTFASIFAQIKIIRSRL